MDHSQLVKNWIQSALGDLKVAENELKFPDEEIVVNAVCFHCQQTIEKLLKAFLIGMQINFSKTHNLENLIVLCSEKDPSFRQIEIGNLTEYAVETRYPDFQFIPSIEDAKASFEITKKAKDLILSKIPIENEGI